MEYLQLSSIAQEVHCPFNLAHVMARKTFIKHLIKCPDRPKDYVNCSFNMLHVMPKDELQKHEENCPSRIVIDSFIYSSNDSIRPVPVFQSEPTAQFTDEESWDNIECSSDVLNTINNATALMKPKLGITKSERKKYRTKLHSAKMATDNIKPDETNNKSGPPSNSKGVLFYGKTPKTKD